MHNFSTIVALCLLTLGSAATLDPSCMLKEITATDERIRAHGYPAESHHAETEDGYILNLFRIPYSHKLQNQDAHRPAILLQHGLFSNSDCWLSTGPDYALGYLLADAGFDVWLGNARGNIYSHSNSKISLKNPKFWHFDWHEIGKIDIPTMIEYIIEETGEQQIHYAGHSQGTTVYFVMMSEYPEYNTKIKSAHMLAPCAFFENPTSSAFKVLKPFVGSPGGIWNQFLADIEILPQNQVVVSAADTACGSDPALMFLCKNLWLLFAADGNQNTNTTALQVLIETHPGGCSSNQGLLVTASCTAVNIYCSMPMYDYIQLNDYNKGRFCQMDYGEKKNKEIYGQATAPDYDLSNIKAPTYFYSSTNDASCSPDDVDILVANTPFLAGDYRVPEPSFNHLDFIVAHNMKELLNDPVMENIFKHEDSL